MKSIYKPLIFIKITPCKSLEKAKLLENTLEKRKNEKKIIRVRTDLTAKNIAKWLENKKYTVVLIHNELNQNEKELLIKEFNKIKNATLVITEGIDIPKNKNIKAICWINLPESWENIIKDLQCVENSRQEVYTEILASKGDYEARLAKIEQEYQVYYTPDEINNKNTNKDFIKKFQKLQQTIEWLEHAGCAWQYLRKINKEKNTVPCGNCDWCKGERRGLLPVE